jgi:hypothetical protein
VLSSTVHALWALRAGGRLGVGNDPTWTNTTTFLPFPFPAEDGGVTDGLRRRIADLAERIDTHRKTRVSLHSDLTLTGLYNCLEKLRNGEVLTVKDRITHEHGLISVLRTLHVELDAAVLVAYGWGDLTLPADSDVLLERLALLNSKRAAEELNGVVRWLRPALRQAAAIEDQGQLDVGTDATEPTGQTSPAIAAASKLVWPVGLPEQIKIVAEVLANGRKPLTLDAVCRFSFITALFVFQRDTFSLAVPILRPTA